MFSKNHDGRYANWNRKEPLNGSRLNWFCEPEPHEPEPGPKLWAGLSGVKFGPTELSIPPIEISRRDLQPGPGSGPGFSVKFLNFGCMSGACVPLVYNEFKAGTVGATINGNRSG